MEMEFKNRPPKNQSSGRREHAKSEGNRWRWWAKAAVGVLLAKPPKNQNSGRREHAKSEGNRWRWWAKAAAGVLLAVVAVAFGGGRGYGEGSMQVEERAEAAVAAMDVTGRPSGLPLGTTPCGLP